MMWVNDGLPFLVNSHITEYDIRQGNVSIMKTFHLAPEDTIRELEALPKDERNVRVGLLQRGDKAFAKALELGFNEAVKQFLEANALDPEIDVLGIKRDAVFVINKPILQNMIGDHILFRPKGQYHAYLQIGPKWEFYFPPDQLPEIKNFVQPKNDINHALERLQPGPFSFLKEFIDIAESSNMDRRKVYSWIKEFCTYYKAKELDVEYYREFTREALFRIRTFGNDYDMVDIITDDILDDLDISFNYVNVIIPLLQILI